jgi:peptide deformylase
VVIFVEKHTPQNTQRIKLMKYKCKDCEFTVEMDCVETENFKKIIQHERDHNNG